MILAASLAIALSSCIAAYWLTVFVRMLLAVPHVPRTLDALDLPAPEAWPRLSVVIPAHNEERVIETCARTLLASDYPNLEIIFVLDRCTDRTRELLGPFERADQRLRVHENRSCPADWAGKCNAARVGAGLATGELLLFTDADVGFDPRLLRAAALMLLSRGCGLLSLLPTLTTHTWFERVVQPAAIMGLFRLYPLDKVNRDRDRRPFANGQFLLFRRELYEAIGGHATVKDDLLEDLAFARVVERQGARGMIAVAEGMLTVNMYGSFAAMREGWKRIYIEACGRKIGRLRLHAVRLFAVAIGGPIAQLAALGLGAALGGWWLVGALLAFAVGAIGQSAALIKLHAQSRTPAVGIAGFPFGASVVAKAFWDGASDLARRRPIRWGGREYVLTPRD